MSKVTGHVMSMRVGSAARVVNGSRTSNCSLCGHDCWVSPSSERPLSEGYKLICNVCGVEEIRKHAQNGEDICCENLMPTNVQLNEIAEALHGPGKRFFKYSR